MSARAIQHLRQQDERLGEWIDRIGVLKLPVRQAREPYIALLETIAYQQLGAAAARAIWNRVEGLFEDRIPRPDRFIELSDAQLRGAGLSGNKALAMRDMSAKALTGHLPDAKRIARMTDTEIYARLTEIRGVGTWTVDMLMLFTLCRPDIMPSTDYGVGKGFQILYRKRTMPRPKQLLKAAEKWRPYRSIATLYLWQIVEWNKKTKIKSLAK